jgi:hypothetical protein
MEPADPSPRLAKIGVEQHHGHHGKILKNQNPDDRPPMDRITVPSIGQRFQDDRRTAE